MFVAKWHRKRGACADVQVQVEYGEGVMALPVRIDINDGLDHVTSRGGERHAVVRDDRDRRRWFELPDR